MPNKYLITAVHLVDLRGSYSLTIRAGVCESADLLAAQAVATFCADHTGFSPVAVASAEVSLEALERAVAMLKDDAPVNAAITRRRGRRPRLAPGMIPAKQEPLTAEDESAFRDHLSQKSPAWGKEIPPGDGVILPNVKAGKSVLVENKGDTPVFVTPGSLDGKS